MNDFRQSSRFAHRWLQTMRGYTTAVLVAFALAACGNKVTKELEARVEGQTEYASAAPNGQSPEVSNSRGGRNLSAGGTGGDEAAAPQADSSKGGDSGSSSPRAVSETDIYRLDGDRLYYLNAYRGLMIFDVSNADAPRFLGRSPITGSPVEMYVEDGFAHVVVADWYGKMEDGKPFHGSIVRSIDAREPTAPRVTGEAKLGGWVRDIRIVGEVLYAVSEDYGWSYGYVAEESEEGVAVSYSPYRSSVIVSSVNFAGGTPTQVSERRYDGYQGIFFVSADAIVLAHDKPGPNNTYYNGQAEMEYLDISDAGGQIVARGKVDVTGSVPWSGSDGGRFNVDFDGRYARLITCRGDYCGGTEGYRLTLVDFDNADAPAIASTENIPSSGWSVAARFIGSRLYISPGSGYSDADTPLMVYDLSNPADPVKAGETPVEGAIWSLLPGPTDRLFALGSNYYATEGAPITLSLINVADAANPAVINQSQFGSGWAWTPAAGTFKAFTMSAEQGLVVLPFSGWGYTSNSYNNGVQLIEFTDTTLTTRGAARTKGWAQRGILVGNRIMAISDQSLAVIDYSNRAQPVVISELELARNVIDVQPAGDDMLLTIGDFWDYDQEHSRIRTVAQNDVQELTTLDNKKLEVDLEGYNPRVFYNGRYAYAVTSARKPVSCDSLGNSTGGSPGVADSVPGGGASAVNSCFAWYQRVQVLDVQDGLKKLGTIELPTRQSYYGYYYGCFPYDWYYGDDMVQVQGDALLLRRWEPAYAVNGKLEDWQSKLHVIDLSDPNEPTIASTTITSDFSSWWGNLRAEGDQVYATHYEWFSKRAIDGQDRWYVKYYLDRLDLSDRKNPKVGSKINVPGMLVGSSGTDLYFVDYRWYNYYAPYSGLAVATLKNDRAVLRSFTSFDGYVGNFIVRGKKAYTTLEQVTQDNGGYYSRYKRHLLEIDLSNPVSPVLKKSEAKRGWGWLLDVEGDRALMTSGWSGRSLDVYKLGEGAPAFDQTLQIRSWWANSVSRVGDDLYLATGYFGVEKLHLK